MGRLLIPLVVLVAIGALLFGALGRNPEVLPSPLINKPAPEFELTTVWNADRTISKSDLLGEPYLLNVWGSWCVACRAEHETLMRLAERDVIDLYGLNFNDKRARAQRWLKQYGDPYVASLYDPKGEVAIDFGAYGAPETFLVDAEGVIRYKHVGPLTPKIIRTELMPRIRQLKRGES